MKLLHISDLHIGLKLYNRDLRDDQIYIFDQIAAIAEEEQPDAVLIAGDIYDKSVPSAEAMETFDYLLNKIADASPKASIMVISGNHDSAPRVNTYRNLLAKRNLYLIGNPPVKEDEYIEKVVLKDSYGDVNFYLLPYVKPAMIRAITGDDENGNLLSYDAAVTKLIKRENIDTNARNVLVSHQFYLPSGASADGIDRMDNEIVTVGNIDQVDGKAIMDFDYAALGHIHKPMLVGDEFHRYSGTPLPCSVSEANQNKGVVIITLNEKGVRSTEVRPLLPKHEVRIIKGTYDEIKDMSSDDYVTVVLTDKDDINAIEAQYTIRNAFPNLLEIRREYERQMNYEQLSSDHKEFDPYELCCHFATFTDEEKELIKEVINEVRGENS